MAAVILSSAHATAEIDKLRELVDDMWLQLLNAYDRKEVDEFADRMRELKIEVDA